MLQVLTRSPKLEKLYWRRIERADDKTENVMPRDEDIEAMVMQVRDLRLRLYQADDSACFDIVRFMPYLSCLRLDIPMGIDKQILISRLGMARTRLAILTNSAVILPSRLKSLEIYNHMALNSKEETDQQKNLIDSEIVALVEYAHPQGLKRLHLKVANISQTLADAIKTPPPTSSFSFSILQDLSLQITDFYSHSCNPIPWIHSILITCPQLRRIHLDLIGSQAKARVFMECAQELFYSPSEGDTQEPMVPWACSQTLQELTILGIQRPRVIDLVNYLDWNCQKPDTSGYMNKFWKKGRDRIHTIFLRSNSISQPNTSVLMNSSSNISHDSYNNKDEHERAHGQRPQPYQQQPPQALIELTRNEMRFNAQLAGQLAQCPNLIRFRLNSRSYMKELEHLRARHKVLKVEQQRVGAATMKLKAELMGN
ncbi:hypothetical protein FBU30_000256 [Linnemannia zychae]|nr:hypothetical protein FBU30_000256 [Linnemannia zychae]